jgi:hypothetical protein
MLHVLLKNKRFVEEDAFGLQLADAVAVEILATVAVVPVEAGDLAKIDHVYITNILGLDDIAKSLRINSFPAPIRGRKDGA